MISTPPQTIIMTARAAAIAKPNWKAWERNAPSPTAPSVALKLAKAVGSKAQYVNFPSTTPPLHPSARVISGDARNIEKIVYNIFFILFFWKINTVIIIYKLEDTDIIADF